VDDTVQTAERLDESSGRVSELGDELTPDDYARLGRAMARVMFAAWRGTHAGAATDRFDSQARSAEPQAGQAHD
jgi:hypothetical protein